MSHEHAHTHDHAHAALDAADYDGLLHEEVHRLADLAASLTPEQWTAPSLCEGWRACDVIGHMTYGGSVPLRSALPTLLFTYKGNLAEGSKQESIKMAASMDQAALVATFVAAHDHPVGFGKLIKTRDIVLDHVVHELDIRRPQGIDRSVPPEILVGALEAVAGAKSKLFSPSKTADGLRLVASDIEWGAGPSDGLTIEGPAEDLLLALGGRRVGLANLKGTGIEELSRRTLPLDGFHVDA